MIVPDPTIEQPTDIIIKVTSSGICGSDLHLYEVLGAFLDAGDVLGHEPIGIVQEVGREVHQGAGQVIGVDLVPERLVRAAGHDVQTLNLEEHDDLPAAVRDLTDGRGPVSVIDAVGMEAHGSPIGRMAHKLTGLLPDQVAQQVMQKAGIDRLVALYMAIELVQRGGTISLSGVYGGAASPMLLLHMFDKQVNVRMGQANVKRWIDDILPLLTGDDDPLGVEDFATHHPPLEEAARGYEIFQQKCDGAFKILLQP